MSEPANRLWDAALGRIQLQIPRPTFDTWLRNTHALRLEGNHLVVSVPSTFTAQWLEDRLQKLILKTLSSISSQEITVAFVVGTENPRRNSFSEPVNPNAPSSINNPLGGTAFYPEYTFKNFIVGPSNQLAYAAAYALASGSPSAYNPLFLYGGVGLGKTHLMNAIGQLATSMGKRVIYVSAEQFTNEYLRAIKERKTDGFRDRYRSVDLLMVDDIQFLNGKEATQDGLFHTFNELHRSGGKLVMSSDRPAGELRLLEARLRSRFEAGLQADLSAPEFETKLAILNALTEKISNPIAREYLEFIATHVHDNVRTLQGVHNRLLAFIEFTGQEPSYELAKMALGPSSLKETPPILDQGMILDFSSKAYGISVKALISPQRTKEASKARQLAAYLLKSKLRFSPDQIGQILGKRDRTTITYAIGQAKEALITDPQFKEFVLSLEKNKQHSGHFNKNIESA